MVTPARAATPGLAALALAALLAFPLAAETVVSAEAAASAGAFVTESGVSSDASLAAGSLTVRVDTARNEAVKASGEFSIDAAQNLTLRKAWMKARLPWLVEGTTGRLTVGLAPLSWGKGFLFNAGDPIFGELPAMAGLSGGDYRTATDWLASLYLPLGDFSFAEAVYLPPVSDGVGTPKDRAGGRVQLVPSRAFLQSVETGWLHDGAGAERGYVAADGSLWADWYGAASFISANPAASVSGKPVTGADWSLSFGLFRILDIPNWPLTLRAEGLAHPGRNAQAWFGLASLGISEIASLGVQGMVATGSGNVSDAMPSGSAIAGILGEFVPLKGFSLSGQVLRAYAFLGGTSFWALKAGAKYEF